MALTDPYGIRPNPDLGPDCARYYRSATNTRVFLSAAIGFIAAACVFGIIIAALLVLGTCR